MVSQGWHRCGSFEVYLDQFGIVLFAVSRLSSPDDVRTYYPYFKLRDGSFKNVSGYVKFSTFRAGLYSGRYFLK